MDGRRGAVPAGAVLDPAGVRGRAPAGDHRRGAPGPQRVAAADRKRQTLKIAAEIAIAERFDLGLRSHYAEELARWACPDGSVHILELSSHPERRLSVVCTAEPALTESRDYAAALRAEWTAYAVPYGEDKLANTLTLTGDDEEDDLIVPGTVPAPVSLTVTPSDALTEMTVTVGDSVIALTGLTVASGTAVTFTRDARDGLLIRAGTTGILSKRTAASADDLLAAPGTVPVAFEADVSCTAVFSVRGRWA